MKKTLGIMLGLCLAFAARAAVIVNYEHTAGSATPTWTTNGVTSAVSLGGLLYGTIATSIDQYSVADANGLPSSTAQTYNYYFSYAVTNSITVKYESLDIDLYAKVATRDFRLSYTIDGGTEIFINEWSDALDDSVHVSVNYNFEDFTTAGVVEFRVYWAGTRNNSGNARVYVDDFVLNGLVIVGDENLPPIAYPQDVTAFPDTALEITLTALDPEGSNLIYNVESSPLNGILTTNGTLPDLIYTPTNGFVGADSFTFSVNDGETDSAPAVVSIMVTNQVPVANNQSVSTSYDTPKAITLTGSDPDNGPGNLTYSVESQPVYGFLTGTAPALIYTPTNGYEGADGFTFTVNDGLADSASATISIDVVNLLPVADAQSLEMLFDTSLEIMLTGSDPEGVTDLIYALGDMPLHGTLIGATNIWVYTPTNNYVGADSFTFTVNDGRDDSTPATVSLAVAEVATGIIVGYDFDDGSGNATTLATARDANVTASDYGVGEGLIDVVNGPNGNSNFSILDAEGDVFGTANGLEYGSAQTLFGFTDMNNANNLGLAIDNKDYMTFTITPDGGYKMALNSFTFRTRVNDLDHSAERWALFSSVGGFTNGAEIVTGRTATTATYVNNVVDLSAAEFQDLTDTIEFRLYIYGGNQSQSSATLFDKVIVKGVMKPQGTVLLVQ